MPKFVVSGCSDCPYFAKAELIADHLKINLPNFQIHKIVKARKEWNVWISELNKINNWKVKESPVIWQELVDRGGKAHLLGGSNEFQEYAKCYYNVIIDFTSDNLRGIALDNIRYKEEHDQEFKYIQSLSRPTKVTIVNASNEAVPHFVLSLARGEVIDKSTELSLIFMDKTENLQFLKGLQLETFDMACPLVRSISITDDYEAGFSDSSLVILFDDVLNNSSETQEQQLLDSQTAYENIGNLIEQYCPTNVKVLLIPTTDSGSINLSLMSVHRMLNRVPKFNVVALSHKVEQQVRSVIAKKLLVNPSNIHSIIVWGDIGGKTFIDLTMGRVHQYDGSVTGENDFSVSVDKTIWDRKWLKHDIQNIVSKRFNDICQLTNRNGNSLGLAVAVGTFLRHWINGDKDGHVHSLVVNSEGWFDIPKDIAFSVPVRLSPKGYWKVVEDIFLSEAQSNSIKECVEEFQKKVNLIYPKSDAKETIDEEFINNQIDSLLEEVYSKDEIKSIKELINKSLPLEDKIDISRSKELLKSIVSDLQNPKVVTTTVTDEELNNEIEKTDDIESIITDDQIYEPADVTEDDFGQSGNLLSERLKDDLEDIPYEE